MIGRSVTAVAFSTLLAAAATEARAQAAAPAAEEADALTPLCTDRPTKSNFACVVDPGHVQVESDLFNGAFQRTGGVTTDTWLVTNPTLKYGVAEDVDVELNVAPYEFVRTRDRGGPASTLGGVGDLYLRLKWNYLDSDDHRWSFAALPYLKAPTARRGIGNGAVEGGMLFPINFEVTSKLTLTTVPEFDAYKDAVGGGRHFSSAQLFNVGYALPAGVTVFGEIWSAWNHDPLGTVRQTSADFAVAWGVTKLLQLDGGVNLGLNRATPGAQVYLGVSRKF